MGLLGLLESVGLDGILLVALFSDGRVLDLAGIKHNLTYLLPFNVVAPMQSLMFCNTRKNQRNVMWHFSLVHALPTLKGEKQVMLDVLVSCLI